MLQIALEFLGFLYSGMIIAMACLKYSLDTNERPKTVVIHLVIVAFVFVALAFVLGRFVPMSI